MREVGDRLADQAAAEEVDPALGHALDVEADRQSHVRAAVIGDVHQRGGQRLTSLGGDADPGRGERAGEADVGQEAEQIAHRLGPEHHRVLKAVTAEVRAAAPGPGLGDDPGRPSLTTSSHFYRAAQVNPVRGAVVDGDGQRAGCLGRRDLPADAYAGSDQLAG